MTTHIMKTTVTITHPGFFEKTQEVYFSQNQILGYLASNIVKQAGVQRAVLDLSGILQECSEFLSAEIHVHVQAGKAKHIVGIVGMRLDTLTPIIENMVEQTSAARLNLRNSEVHGDVYSEGKIELGIGTEYQNENEAPENFTDLGALSRNILNDLIYEQQITQS